MKISVYNQSQEILVQTISVKKNPTNPDNALLFFCPYCSHQILQIQGVVGKISPGLDPTDEVITINKCPRCEMRYTVQSHPTKGEWTSTILTRYKNDEPSFRCYICRTPLLNFDYNSLYDLILRRFVGFPYQRICPNKKCPGRYFITDIV